MDSSEARIAGQGFYSTVHVFFMILQDLINSTPQPKSTDSLEVVCFVSVVCRCAILIEASAYSLHSSYFSVSLQNSQKPKTFK